MGTPTPSRPLELFFLPFLAPGHMIPLFEMARLFAARGEHVTFITTPSNATTFRKTIDKDTAAGHHIVLHQVPFPSKEVGLPDGLENLSSVKDIETGAKLHTGVTLLRERIEEFIDAHRPDCIISDMFYPWTSDVAVRLRIPRLVFHATCNFAMSLKDAISRPDSPHLKVQSDDEPFIIPGLPDPITMTRSQIPENRYLRLTEIFREAELKSYGVLVNNFYELDSAYTQHYKKVMGHRVFNIGPAVLIHRNAQEKAQRGHDTVAVSENDCLSFLNSKRPNSVLYICFGSACIFPDEQLMEIACGLEASGSHFIWVVLGKEKNNEEEEGEDQKDKWLPRGFEERINGRGMIIRGWAPQVLILDHPSVGGFLTHCGWNSVIEGVSAGVPLITWPLYAEHFYLEKLVTQVLGIGVEVGKMNWNLSFDVGKEVIKKENIERAVRRLMNDSRGDPAAEIMRQKAKELGEKAHKAVQEGGSSHRNLTLLIEELKQLREQRKG